MIRRRIESELQKLSTEFKAVVVTGPRQSGKTTLVRAVFPNKPYVLLEEPDTRTFAAEDPRGFLAQFPSGAILDEVQRVPDLFSYLQGLLDNKQDRGQYILTGSFNFNLMESVTQSLAGRVGILELLPFSLEELKKSDYALDSVDTLLFQGLYPAIYDQKPRVTRWYNAYIMTYLERDVRQLINLKNVSSFQKFLGLCASNVGQILNTVRMGADCGINHNTVQSWLSILETSYIIFRLQPHHRNFRKRLVKTSKLYFNDTGLAARLLGIENKQQLATHPMRGLLFENWCITELMKGRLNRGLPSNLFFWRDNKGMEIDVIADRGNLLLPVEIKSGATIASDWMDNLQKWLKLADESAEEGWIIYGGDKGQIRNKTTILPWHEIERLCENI